MSDVNQLFHIHRGYRTRGKYSRLPSQGWSTLLPLTGTGASTHYSDTQLNPWEQCGELQELFPVSSWVWPVGMLKAQMPCNYKVLVALLNALEYQIFHWFQMILFPVSRQAQKDKIQRVFNLLPSFMKAYKADTIQPTEMTTKPVYHFTREQEASIFF